MSAGFTPEDIDALRYILNFADSNSRVSTVMRCFTLPGRVTVEQRLERLYAALQSSDSSIATLGAEFGADRAGRASPRAEKLSPPFGDHHGDGVTELRAALLRIVMEGTDLGAGVAMTRPAQIADEALRAYSKKAGWA